MRTQRRTGLATAVLVFGGAIMQGVPGPMAAHAMINTCRSDPKFYLSNSRKVTLAYSIPSTTTFISSVKYVTYTLHVPSGITVSSVNTTGDTFPEQWTVTADAAPNEYYATGMVVTSSGTYSVTFSEQVVYQTGANGGNNVTLSAAGTTNASQSVDIRNGP